MEDNDKTPAATTDTAPADNVHGNAQDAPGVIITLNTGGKGCPPRRALPEP